jgi:uncharacterized protein (DUF4415 family)
MSKAKPILHMPSDEEDRLITAAAESDPDAQPLTDEFMQRPFKRGLGRPKASVTKTAIAIRLDPDIIAYFKNQGRGWQTKLNEVLDDYVKQHR